MEVSRPSAAGYGVGIDLLMGRMLCTSMQFIAVAQTHRSDLERHGPDRSDSHPGSEAGR